MNAMIAIDIGNTNTTVGYLLGGVVAGTFKIESALFKNKRRCCGALEEKTRHLNLKNKIPEAVCICSVVPELREAAKNIFGVLFKKTPSVIGYDIPVPIINRYRIPSQVGQDRLVSAYAGLKLYGSGLIIVDFGTAITFDIVSKKSEYLGGLIVPGLKLMRESLHKKTALLPYVELARPIEIIGRDTVSSIRAGIVYGAASLCDGIIERLQKKECRGYKVVATGGDANLIKSYSTRMEHFEDGLVLKGLYLISASQKHMRR